MFSSKQRRFWIAVMSDSFNPCSLGCFPRSVLLTGNEKIKASFNPCSLGCFPRRVNMMNQITHQNGFNPCSLGCFPRSLQGSGFLFVELFQSLFSWMFSSKFFLRIGPFQYHVSILVLLDVFLEVLQPGGLQKKCSSFNPCSLGCFPRSSQEILFPGFCDCQFQSLFSWMFSSKSGSWWSGPGNARVSILVLLDVFLEGLTAG